MMDYLLTVCRIRSCIVSGHTKACYESDRGGSFVGSSVLVEAPGKPRLGRSLAYRAGVNKNETLG